MAAFSDVVDSLLEHTEKGPVSEWVERLADVARGLNLPLRNIEWNGTPTHVATSLVSYSLRYYSSHDPLLSYLKLTITSK